ncbi:glycogen/starch/alpha-glucan phosphorylase [Timonella senegalensis]|uniref:glycogen/starch/alpha-glucan phosphorylase n=1 Tax=Timonella senegalensis TaxID=1465825 RepID=UPI002FDE7E2F
MDTQTFASLFLEELQFTRGTTLEAASEQDKYIALVRVVRRSLIERWHATNETYNKAVPKTVAYLSAEYLLGPQTGNTLLATDLESTARAALSTLGIDLDDVIATEIEPGLGNGGLGRLAACFIDSLATLNIPAIGYGIRYNYGIFRQTFVDGQQVEQPDTWMSLGTPWELPHPEKASLVGFGGHVEETISSAGMPGRTWVPAWHVQAVPCDYLVPGYDTENVNTLRLWSARATDEFNLQIFNSGDFENAVRARTAAENISNVLYPEDSTPQGKELRLQQQYFFVAASVRDLLDRYLGLGVSFTNLPEHITFQLNDTHPVVAIPEFMRLLMDEHGLEWDEAWGITQRIFNYTCHTLLPEALEVWSVDLFGRLLPRHLEIIFKINEVFLDEVRAKTGNELLVRQMSIIQEQPFRAVRMAHLATVASARVNGVAELHSQLLRDNVLKDFSAYWPDKFTNVTNGVTPRRFVRLSNPELSNLLDDAIGSGWTRDLAQLSKLEELVDDEGFLEQFARVKSLNKQRIAAVLAERDGIELPADAMYDVMVKRLHEYKRQSLKLLHVVSLYARVLAGTLRAEDIEPRVVVFGAKAAPGYRMAKDTISLINAVAATINNAPELRGRLKIAFPANYNVTLAEKLIPAADLSEQISLAGKEASGTGNMKFALNGALTVGTLDGANVEIHELVGDENFFLFGMTEPEAESLAQAGYTPSKYYEQDEDLKLAIDLIASGAFSGGERSTFEPIVSDWLWHDRFMALADFRAYVDVQQDIEAKYRDAEAWNRSAVLNVARSGFFSSDRSISDYLDRVWHATPLPAARRHTA